MKRRDFLALTACATSIRPAPVDAQGQLRVRKVGLLNSAGANAGPFEGPLMRGLAKHGYVPDKNLVIETRGAEGHADRLPRIIADLVASKVEVIIALGYLPAIACKQETTLPVVEFSGGDPIATKLADSLAHPGGHITGISDVSAEVTPKRLDLLKEFAPKLRRVAMLYNADDLAMVLRYKAADAGARALGLEVRAFGVREPADFEQAIDGMKHEMPNAILMVSDPLTNLNRKGIFEFAVAHRLPGIYEYDFLVRDGGLMSYGLDLEDAFDRLGGLVDRILKGDVPAQLPFEQPVRFRFALNLKTAKAIGFDPPQSLIILADEIIE